MPENDSTAQTAPETPPPAATAPEQPPADDKNLGPAGEKALEEWKARAKAAEAEAKAAKALREQIKQYEDKDKTDLQKATERAVAAEKSAADATRLRVAVLKGYSGEQAIATADLLRGDTEDELTSHLDRLVSSGVLAAAGVSTKPTGSADGGARGTAGETGNFTEWVRQQAGIT